MWSRGKQEANGAPSEEEAASLESEVAALFDVTASEATHMQRERMAANAVDVVRSAPLSWRRWSSLARLGWALTACGLLALGLMVWDMDGQRSTSDSRIAVAVNQPQPSSPDSGAAEGALNSDESLDRWFEDAPGVDIISMSPEDDRGGLGLLHGPDASDDVAMLIEVYDGLISEMDEDQPGINGRLRGDI